MSDYIAPLRDMQFILKELAGLDAVSRLPGCEEASADLAEAVLDEAGKFAAGVLAPINQKGDLQGCKLENGKVQCPDGWKEAYDQFQESGWIGLNLPTEFGGQGLPKLIATPVWEMWFSANMAFSMLPQLNVGQAEAMLTAASDALKQTYLHKVVSGEWGGTMNLTEPQAGSDLAATRTRAEPQADGTYRIFGQKIFISYGEHELTENIVHLVLARLPDAPAGIKGISLFVVPKYLVNADGSLGAKNDLRCISIEHKMGIHGSPTCAMSYGDEGGAIGYLVGEANRGIEYMFIMMNEARFGVGVQGCALAERAYQSALAYARERVQGRNAITGENNKPIVHHPDVKRMLATMRARVMAMRTLLYTAASWFDMAHHSADQAEADKCRRYVDLLMPIAKGWSTEVGNDICDEAIQVFGGMGFVEETGIAQQFRDARIITIYEGTTGIQANDLIGRKILRENGATLRELLVDIRDVAANLSAQSGFAQWGADLAEDATALEAALDWMLANSKEHLDQVLAGAVPFLHLLGTVCGSWQMGRLALTAERLRQATESPAYYAGLISVAGVWFGHCAPQAQAWARVVRCGGASIAECDDASL